MKESNTTGLQDAKIKALLYGKSKTGKTSSALTLKPETTLILSAESGLLPLASKNFTVWEIENFEDMITAYKRLQEPEMQKKFKVIFIDSLTEVNELCKEQILRGSRPVESKEPVKVTKEMMTQPNWGILLVRMVGLVRKFRDLPYHVIFTALEDNVKDELMGGISFIPSLNGKFATNVPGFFDEVFRMVTKEEEGKMVRYFYTAKAENTITGDRSGALDDYEKPSWAVVFKKIFDKFKVREEK